MLDDYNGSHMLRFRMVGVILLAACAHAQPVYDLLLKGGHVIDRKRYQRSPRRRHSEGQDR